MVFYRLGEGWDRRGRKIFGLVTITQSPYKVLKYSDDPLQLRSIVNFFFFIVPPIKSVDQYQYLGNCPPTPPLTCYQLTVVESGEGSVGSCSDTDIDPNLLRTTDPLSLSTDNHVIMP